MIKAILTDIEGTTTSLSFVKDVLFPYARSKMGDFIKTHEATAEVAALLAEVRTTANLPNDCDHSTVVRQLVEWIDADRKLTPLKALQGMIWEEGYRNGDFFGHVYPDAVERLRDWKQQGMTLCIFSSGSVHAQKLLFAHTEWGDLTPLFSGYYDTRVGAKQEAPSYREIARLMGVEPDTVLFLSDMEGELEAARQSGMVTCHLVREDSQKTDSRHPVANDFTEVDALLRRTQSEG